MVRANTIEDFWPLVDKRGPMECWPWRQVPDGWGYGMFQMSGWIRKAHRVAWELTVGPIPEGLTIDHLCRNPICVNPEHLEPVTMGENIRRARAAKTHCRRGHSYAGIPMGRSARPRCPTCAEDNRLRKSVRAKQKWAEVRTGPKTHCKRGHAFDEANTYWSKDGRRACRACGRAAANRYNERKRAAQEAPSEYLL